MTTPRRDNTQEPWAAWIQRNPNLDSVRASLCCTNSDLWVHRYKSHVDKVGTRELQHLMLIEVKTHGRQVPSAQADTYHLVDQILRRKDKRPYKRPTVGVRWVRCWGVHYVIMSGECPATSDWMTWDGKPITVTVFEELLRFERNPDTLEPRTDRRHHRPSQFQLLQTTMDTSGGGASEPSSQ